MSDTDDLGPLPKVDRNNELQRLSIKALQGALPVSRFLFRDERMDDYGVDGSLEVLHGGRATNLRAQVQLKSMEKTEPNKDGSISYSVKVSNLNHLLNGPSPLYVLYSADSGKLQCAWARDEHRRIERENPRWKEQETVTLRFEKALDPAGLDAIFTRILQEARLHRRLMDTVSGAAPGRIAIEFDPSKLTLRTEEEIHQVLQSSGYGIVAAGYPSEVVELAQRLSPALFKQPRIQLLVAYAEYRRGRYLSTEARLAEARLGQQQLPPSEMVLLNFLVNICDFETGRIDQATYEEREARLVESAPVADQREYGFKKAKQQLVREWRPQERETLFREMRELLAEVNADPEIPESTKLEFQIHFAETEGEHHVLEFLEQVYRRRSRQVIGVNWAAPEPAGSNAWLSGWRKWESEIERLRGVAAAMNHPLLLAQAILTEAIVWFHLMVQQKRSSLLPGDVPLPAPPETLYPLMERVEQAREVYAKADSLNDELRATLLLADMFAFIENGEAARKLAEGVLPRASVMRYEGLVRRAQEHINGKWFGNDIVDQVAEL